MSAASPSRVQQLKGLESPSQMEKVLTFPSRENRDKHPEEGKAGGVKCERACGEMGQL